MNSLIWRNVIGCWRINQRRENLTWPHSRKSFARHSRNPSLMVTLTIYSQTYCIICLKMQTLSVVLVNVISEWRWMLVPVFCFVTLKMTLLTHIYTSSCISFVYCCTNFIVVMFCRFIQCIWRESRQPHWFQGDGMWHLSLLQRPTDSAAEMLVRDIRVLALPGPWSQKPPITPLFTTAIDSA